MSLDAVEIEQAITDFAERPFDLSEFPFAFLEAYGNKDISVRKLHSGASNKSDLGGVLHVNHIYVEVAELGTVSETLNALRDSASTQNKRLKVRFSYTNSSCNCFDVRRCLRDFPASVFSQPDNLAAKGSILLGRSGPLNSG